MDENNTMSFSWSAFFIVTACSSFIFSLLLKLLDGNFSPLLIKIGLASFALAIINWLVIKLTGATTRKRSSLHH